MWRLFVAFILLSLPLASVAGEKEKHVLNMRAADVVRTRMDLDTRGMRYIIRVERDKKSPPLKFEIEGPFHNEKSPVGLLVTIRF